MCIVAVAATVGEAIPRGYGELRDQPRRAAISVPLNIAEGACRASEAEGARHFAFARGSAMECAAVLDVVRVLGVWMTTDTGWHSICAQRAVAMHCAARSPSPTT